MKVAIVLGIILTCGSIGFAQDDTSSPEPEGKTLEQFLAEKRAFCEKTNKAYDETEYTAWFNKMDLDKNGRLTEGEKAGILTREQFLGQKKTYCDSIGAPFDDIKYNAMFDKADVNKDGKVTPEELEAAYK